MAHSMGGLLAREVSLDPAVQPLVRTCVTLGTPFHGTPKAAVLLNSGRGLPFLPARRTEDPRRENEWGDGTVPSCSAEVPGVRPAGRLFQSHSDLGKADEVVRWVARVLRDGDLRTGGPPLGTGTGRTRHTGWRGRPP